MPSLSSLKKNIKPFLFPVTLYGLNRSVDCGLANDEEQIQDRGEGNGKLLDYIEIIAIPRSQSSNLWVAMIAYGLTGTVNQVQVPT